MENIAIIPARSGSRGLKNKNIKLLAGKPLIKWTIEAALKSMLFKKVIVTTDSQLYAEIASSCGAEIPFIRSPSLSTDKAGSLEVVIDCLDFYRDKGISFDYFCLLQPTSPLRTATNIAESYQVLLNKKADAVVSICESEHPPMWQDTIDETGSLENFADNNKLQQRQRFKKFFRLNGAIYWGKPQNLVKYKRFLSFPNSYSYIMTKEHSIDIDDDLDFRIAELLLSDS